MEDQTFILRRGSTWLRMADPRAAEPYYRGTRFDRTGVILDLESGGHRFVSQWFKRYDPYMHDAVGGPAEEFTQIGYQAFGRPSGASIGETKSSPLAGKSPLNSSPERPFLKIGVGVLKGDAEEYDRFKLYEVLDPGRMEVTVGEAEASFRHVLDGYYDYQKTVQIPDQVGGLIISHALRNCSAAPLECHVYCHNFFILDGATTGRATRFEFPFRPVGDWRAPYDSVRLSERGIVFDRDLAPGESVFMGNLRPADSLHLAQQGGYSFKLSNLANGLSVEACCDRAMDYAVFWSNHEVSCLEPYIPLRILPGETVTWTLSYRLLHQYQEAHVRAV